jgi:hypothetical protein
MENQKQEFDIQLNKHRGYPVGLMATSPTTKNRIIDVSFVDEKDAKVGDTVITWKPYPKGYLDNDGRDSGQLRGTITEVIEVRDAHKNYPVGSRFNRVVVECI